MNIQLLSGNLTTDPDIYRNGETVKASFDIAVNEGYYKDNKWVDQASYHSIVAWGYLAEKAEKNLQKGTSVNIIGKTTHRAWIDQSGNKRNKTEVVASTIEVNSRRKVSEEKTQDPYISQEIESLPNEPDDLPF